VSVSYFLPHSNSKYQFVEKRDKKNKNKYNGLEGEATRIMANVGKTGLDACHVNRL
jgi:hypothetical protein